MDIVELLSPFREILPKDVAKINVNLMFLTKYSLDESEKNDALKRVAYHFTKIISRLNKYSDKYKKIAPLNFSDIAEAEKKFYETYIFNQSRTIDKKRIIKHAKNFDFKKSYVRRILKMLDSEKYIYPDIETYNYKKHFVNLFDSNVFIPTYFVSQEDIEKIKADIIVVINRFTEKNNISLLNLNEVKDNSLKIFSEIKRIEALAPTKEDIISVKIRSDEMKTMSVLYKYEDEKYRQCLLADKGIIFNISDVANQKFLLYHPKLKEFYNPIGKKNKPFISDRFIYKDIVSSYETLKNAYIYSDEVVITNSEFKKTLKFLEDIGTSSEDLALVLDTYITSN